MNGFEPRCEIDGVAATAEQLARIARINHGHFTSLQVRAGAARALDLHLARLCEASILLYRTVLDPQHVRNLLRHALRGVPDATARITVFAPEWSLASMPQPARLGVLINVLPPAVPDRRPLRLCTIEHERFLPQVKHVGTFALFQLRAQARRDGFDDALFVDRHGCISEGTTWNIGFRDGHGVVWPEAPQLRGIAMQLLERGLAEAGIGSVRRAIRREDLHRLSAPFVCNSSGVGRAVASIDGIALAQDEALLRSVSACYDAMPWQAI